MNIEIKEQNIVLTGKLSSTRVDITNMITNAGGKVSKSVSSKTDLLVVGERPGSKYNQAKSMGIPIITEQKLLELLKGNKIAVSTATERSQTHDAALSKVFGEVRSILQAPPSQARWNEIITYVDRCDPSQIEPLCDYIQTFMNQWDEQLLQGSFKQDYTQAQRADWYSHARMSQVHHDMMPEFRLAPHEWIGELSQGVRLSKYNLIRALDFGESKLSSAAINKLITHPDLSHLTTLVLSRHKEPTPALIKRIAAHPTLNNLTLRRIQLKTIEALEACGEDTKIKVLNLSTLDSYVTPIPNKEQRILAAPLFQGVQIIKLHSQKGSGEASVHEWLATHPDVFNALHTLHYTRGLNPKALTTHLHNYPESFAQFSTLKLSNLVLHYKKSSSENLWNRFVGVKLPKTITTLDISDIQLIVPTTKPQHYNAQKQEALSFIFKRLTQDKILRHINTLKLGIYGLEPTVLEHLNEYAPQIELV